MRIGAASVPSTVSSMSQAQSALRFRLVCTAPASRSPCAASLRASAAIRPLPSSLSWIT